METMYYFETSYESQEIFKKVHYSDLYIFISQNPFHDLGNFVFTMRTFSFISFFFF